MKTWMYWAIIAILIVVLVLQRKQIEKVKAECKTPAKPKEEPNTKPGSKE